MKKKRIIRIGDVRRIYPSGGGGQGDEEYTIESDTGRMVALCKAGVAFRGFFVVGEVGWEEDEVVVAPKIIASLARAYYNCMNEVGTGDPLYAGRLNIGGEIDIPSEEEAERICDAIAERLRGDPDYRKCWFENGFPRYAEDVETFEGESANDPNYRVLTRLTPEQVAYNREHGLR